MLARHAVLLTAPEAEPRLLRLASCTILVQRKFFSCNTYGFPRKCCRQKTYGMAKFFRCNIYKKQGGGGPALRHSGAQPCARSGHRHPSAPHSYPHGSLSTDHGSPCHIGISPKLPTGKPSNPQTNGQSPPLLHCPPMARQRLGQHFLADLHWREEIARAIRVSPHSTVPLPRDDQHCWIEIGS